MTHSSVPKCIITLALGAIMACLCLSPASAETLRSIRSRHYEVITDAETETAQRIASHMDAVHEEYDGRFVSFGKKGQSRVRLYLFNTQQGYITYLRSQGISAENTGGMFFARNGESGLATWIEGQDERRMYHVLQHEGFHQFAHHRIGRSLPIWINEGIAEYFGEAILIRGEFEVGVVPESRLRRVQRAVDSGTSFSFDELLEMTSERWANTVTSGDNRASLMYDQSWAIVHFLIHGEDGRFVKAFEEYLHHVAAGVSPEVAFTRAFGSPDTEPFEAAWRRFILDAEPDPLSAAAERMDFLAMGLGEMHRRGIEIVSIDQLHKQLRDVQFRVTRTENGIETVYSAMDDQNFEAPTGRRGRNARIEIVPQRPSRSNRALSTSLPPEIRITGLAATVYAQWRWDESGNPEYQIVFR